MNCTSSNFTVTHQMNTKPKLFNIFLFCERCGEMLSILYLEGILKVNTHHVWHGGIHDTVLARSFFVLFYVFPNIANLPLNVTLFPMTNTHGVCLSSFQYLILILDPTFWIAAIAVACISYHAPSERTFEIAQDIWEAGVTYSGHLLWYTGPA